MDTSQEAGIAPPHYPQGGTYADFLAWHLFYWGTREDGDTTFNGQPWDRDDFVLKAFDASDSGRVGLYNWLAEAKPPNSSPNDMNHKRIKSALFGTNAKFKEWQEDLDQARERSTERRNRRTKTFPDPPPTPLPINATTASIPRLTPYFLGRDLERERLVEALLSEGETPPSILVQGGPGIGKTELTKAIAHHSEVAKRFGQRRFFIPLETASSVEAMQDAIMRGLGLDPKSGFEAALALLKMNQSLLILDNLETPWEPVSQRSATETVLADLGEAASIVASFRGNEAIDGLLWRTHLVDALMPTSSVDLFASISGQWIRDDPDLGNFIEALGGLPLALVLVARRAYGRNSLSPLWQEWKKIGTDFAIRPRFDTDRLTSLTCSIELSLLSLCSPEGEHPSLRLFRILGALPAGLSYEDAEILMEDSAFAAIERLFQLGIAVERGNRIDLLPPVREHAHRNYSVCAENIERLMNHYLKLARELGIKVGGAEGHFIFQRLSLEFDNIEFAFDNAIASGQLKIALETLQVIARFIHIGSFITHIFDKLLEACQRVRDNFGQAQCLQCIGDNSLSRSQYSIAKEAFYKAIPLYKLAKYSFGVANCLSGLAVVEMAKKSYEKSRFFNEEALKIYNDLGHELAAALRLSTIAEISILQNNNDEAEKILNGVLPVYNKHESTLAVANTFKSLGDIALARFKNADAIDKYNNALEFYRQIGSTHGEANCIMAIGDIACLASDKLLARSLYEDALALYTKIDFSFGQAECLDRMESILSNKSECDSI